MTAAFAVPEPSSTTDVGFDTWFAVLEFGQSFRSGPIRFEDVHMLVEELAGWHPSAIVSDERYAIQMQISASGHHHVLRAALASHDRAVQEVGFRPLTLLRAEVLSSEEMERTSGVIQQADIVTASRDGSVTHCAEVYAATRSLLAATTEAEVANSVDQFVAAIGARVEPGAPRHLPGTTDVSLKMVGGPARHASAEALSVAGLVLEQSLPSLVVDARRALARLEGLRLQSSAAAAPSDDENRGDDRWPNPS